MLSERAASVRAIDVSEEMGCDLIQGDYFSKSLPAVKFEQLLTRGGTQAANQEDA